ncbi:13394_t:CDS:2 [Rhizophagus irregularis]|nr:13394_t:CDS:2 [Rhizophagus irregularis]
MNQNHNFSHNPQLADLQAGGQDNLNPFYNFDSLNMNAFNTLQNHFHDNINNTNGYYPNVNLPDTTFQPQLNRSNIFIFEIPGFEIVIRPKIVQPMILATNITACTATNCVEDPVPLGGAEMMPTEW